MIEREKAYSDELKQALKEIENFRGEKVEFKLSQANKGRLLDEVGELNTGKGSDKRGLAKNLLPSSIPWKSSKEGIDRCRVRVRAIARSLLFAAPTPAMLGHCVRLCELGQTQFAPGYLYFRVFDKENLNSRLMKVSTANALLIMQKTFPEIFAIYALTGFVPPEFFLMLRNVVGNIVPDKVKDQPESMSIFLGCSDINYLEKIKYFEINQNGVWNALYGSLYEITLQRLSLTMDNALSEVRRLGKSIIWTIAMAENFGNGDWFLDEKKLDKKIHWKIAQQVTVNSVEMMEKCTKEAFQIIEDPSNFDTCPEMNLDEQINEKTLANRLFADPIDYLFHDMNNEKRRLIDEWYKFHNHDVFTGEEENPVAS